jgi:CBS domain-containing protein
MKIKDVMHTNPVSLDKNASIYDVWKVIYKKHILAVPIVDGRDHLIGIISFSDILKKIFPRYDIYEWDVSKVDLEKIEENAEEISKLKAEDIMSKRVYTLDEGATVVAALSKMIIKQVNQLPVTNEKNKLVGTIYKVDIFDSLFTKFLKK